MRIAIVIYGSLDILSGGYLYDRRLVEHLGAAGDEVQVVALPWRNYAAHLADALDRNWARRLSAIKADLILQDELNHPSLVWANRSLRQRVGCPLVSIVHHLRSSEEHPAGLRWLYRPVERAYLKGVDSFVWNSQTTRVAVETLLGHSSGGVVATPGGDRFGAGLAEEAIRARCQAGGPLRLVFAGNLIRRKGLHTLVQALETFSSPDWTLEVIGQEDVDPAYARQLRGRIARAGLGERIHFRGRLSEESLRQALIAGQVMVMPSSYEGFGIVYLEGMAFGLPAIASQAGGAGEVIQDGRNGFLVPPNAPLELAGAIRKLLSNRELLLQHSLAARQRFGEFPGWEETTRRIRTYLLGLISNRN